MGTEIAKKNEAILEKSTTKNLHLFKNLEDKVYNMNSGLFLCAILGVDLVTPLFWSMRPTEVQHAAIVFSCCPCPGHTGCRNKAANSLGCSLSSHASCYSREAQCGYLKCQLAATADYTSSLGCNIIKEKRIYVFFRVESSMWKLTLSLPNTPIPFPGSLQKSSTLNKNMDATTDSAWQKGSQ